MTSEPLYKECTASICQRYMQMVANDLEEFIIPKYTYQGNLMELISYKEAIERTYKEARDYTVMEITTDIAGEIRSYFSQEFDDYERKKQELESSIQQLTSKRKSEYNMKAEQIREAAKGTVAPLEAKHAELMEYKEKLRHIMEHYGITPNDIEISPDISREEFEALLETSLSVCKTADNKTKQLMMKLLVPLADDDEKVAYVYSAIL